jgi:universal stress protein E
MREVRRMLVAIDLHRDGLALTAGSCIAVDQAVELARRLRCEVVLLHAMDAQASPPPAPDARACAQRVLEQQAARFRSAGVEAAVAIGEEAAGLAIVRCVLRERIDLVIAGRRNERVHRGRMLGSVAMQLLRTCPCAVWVAKIGGSVAPRCVLAASDLSADDDRVIDYAAFIASAHGATLHIVHGTQQEETARSRSHAEEIARAGGATRVHLHDLDMTPVRAVLDGVTRFEPDLVVMGTQSRAGVLGRLLGSNAEQLLSRLDVSLLAVKPADFTSPVRMDA